MGDVEGSHFTTRPTGQAWTRRRLLTVGLGGAAAIIAVGGGGLELVAHGILPGQQRLDQLDGACSVTDHPLDVSTPGPSISGHFTSAARHRVVGYTIGYPPGHGEGDALPLVVMLHGYGGNHTNALAGMSPGQAVALRIGGRPLPPLALVTVDGGNHYWNPHPGDDPMAMVVDELLPMVQATGLGRPPHKIGTMGISMGGYGALLLAEKYPHLFSAVAAISPAIWTTYSQARTANGGAYASARDFADDDAVSNAGALAGVRVRVATGDSDPFLPGVQALARVLLPDAVVEFSGGCHTGPYFLEQEPPSLSFLAHHLVP
jgi:enterochelin esterase-like enzyme